MNEISKIEDYGHEVESYAETAYVENNEPGQISPYAPIYIVTVLAIIIVVFAWSHLDKRR